MGIAVARQWHVTGRGRALHRWTAVVVAAYALESVLLVWLSLSPDADGVDLASVVVEDAAEACFVGLLLAIAGGFSISRPDLGPHRAKVVAVPLVYFTTALVVDLTEEVAAIKGVDVDAGGMTASAALIFNGCQIAALVALLLAWVFIFDVSARERDALVRSGEGIVGARDGGAEAGAGAGSGGHRVTLPPEVAAAAAERGSDLTDVYAPMATDASADEGKSAADVVESAAKLSMLRRFIAGVTAYVAVRAAAILVPLIVLTNPGDADAAVTAVLLTEDAARWLFLAALAWIFRPRPDSPYLMVGEAGGGEVTTELGVVAPRGGGAAATRAPLFAGARSDAPAPGGGPVDARFALGDSDSDYGGSGKDGKEGGGSRARARASSATHEIPL